jgi:hypothetical protein
LLTDVEELKNQLRGGLLTAPAFWMSHASAYSYSVVSITVKTESTRFMSGKAIAAGGNHYRSSQEPAASAVPLTFLFWKRIFGNY